MHQISFLLQFAGCLRSLILLFLIQRLIFIASERQPLNLPAKKCKTVGCHRKMQKRLNDTQLK